VEGNKDCYSFGSLEEVIDKLENGEFKEQYENVWVIGGSYIYEVPK
jgi:dihydrofolate reductase